MEVVHVALGQGLIMDKVARGARSEISNIGRSNSSIWNRVVLRSLTTDRKLLRHRTPDRGTRCRLWRGRSKGKISSNMDEVAVEAVAEEVAEVAEECVEVGICRKLCTLERIQR